MQHVLVARGASYPIGVPLETGTFVHGDNGMGNMPLPRAKHARKPPLRSAGYH